MKAPEGSVVSIAYDGAPLDVGDILVTATDRTYVVVSVRRQTRGVHAGRQHLRCAVAEVAARGTGKVFPLYWYKREKKLLTSRRQRR